MPKHALYYQLNEDRATNTYRRLLESWWGSLFE